MEMKVDDESVDLFVFSEPLPASSFMQFINSCNSLTDSLIHPFIYSFIHAIHLFIYSLILKEPGAEGRM